MQTGGGVDTEYGLGGVVEEPYLATGSTGVEVLVGANRHSRRSARTRHAAGCEGQTSEDGPVELVTVGQRKQARKVRR